MRLLVTHGVDVNCQTTKEDYIGYTALMFGSLLYWNIHSVLNILNTFNEACVYGHLEIAKILIANGADPKLKNKEQH